MNSHIINRTSRNIIVSSIPWKPTAFLNHFQTDNWINNKATGNHTPLKWIYHVTSVSFNLVQAIEFSKASPNGLIRAVSTQEVTLSPENYHLTRVLVQEKHGTPFKVIKDLSILLKSSLFWFFETGSIENLPWDPGEWH
jgi:hypothetical protein